ncbi:uncharacterized protein PV07_12599 [Cladophialophora immunda]|uniref:Glycosyl transferase family 25 domain-containing protein n=1 Tax=Cladophialophora immunda TaxID=569365 RepID=A0A0D1Z335_9EURO|nr:uncharacterized protein PV07_12599 [Cladophialophora immunda]KIW22001.1 hypothetical protein PV07_12599 [Cladophialophora immunda]
MVQNQTLGFQEIYMISLPERTDKRDAFALQAAFSGISYTVVDGVHGDEVPSHALPNTMDQRSNVVGCWRAHVNVLQRMVREGVSTALIFEDDADWDVALKHQLVQFARGSRFILSAPGEELATLSPYGDDWDILWLGHCGTSILPDEHRRFFVIPNDPTVEPPHLRQENYHEPNTSHWRTGPDGGSRTRIVFRSGNAACTAAYAISQKGAKKALYYLSMVPYNDPIDLRLAALCKSKVKCISPWPQLVGVSWPTGNAAKWSDIGYGPDSEATVQEGKSLHLMYSVRQNLPNMLEGQTVFDSQYPRIAPPMSIEDLGSATGYPETLEPGDFLSPPKDKTVGSD